MDLYFAPLACSMATRVALAETGAPATFIQVDTKAGRVADGADYRAVNPLGQVPVLRLDDGTLLTENTAILQYVARRGPQAALLGAPDELHVVQRWLSFVGTELHKSVFTPLFSSAASEDAKAQAREAAAVRFGVLDAHLAGREFLASAFTVADAYLATVLNWCRAVEIDLGRWPAVLAYHKRMLARPSIAQALAEERRLYAAEEAARAA